jgi:hypothetical protein
MGVRPMNFLDIHGNEQPMTPGLSPRTWLVAILGIVTLWTVTVVAGFCL